MPTMRMSLGIAMGIGNITGVASAIAIDGEGDIFLMWDQHFWAWQRSTQRIFFGNNTAMTT